MRALPAAVQSWIVMMVVGAGLGALTEFWRRALDASTLVEYLMIGALVMGLPFAVAIMAVFWPVAATTERRSSGPRSPIRVGLICAAASPLAGVLLLVLGSLRWGPPRFPGTALALAMACAFAAGGLTFGAMYARPQRDYS